MRREGVSLAGFLAPEKGKTTRPKTKKTKKGEKNTLTRPVEDGPESQEGILGTAPCAAEGGLIPARLGLFVRRDAEVRDGVDGHDAGSDLFPHGGHLADGEGEAAAGGEAGDAHLGLVEVGRQGCVVKDGGDLRLEVQARSGIRVGGGLGVVEGDDEGRVGVAKGRVPEVVVGRVAHDEAAAVDGQQQRQRPRPGRGPVVRLGKEDAHRQMGAAVVRLDEGGARLGGEQPLVEAADRHGRANDQRLHRVHGGPIEQSGQQRLGRLNMAGAAGVAAGVAGVAAAVAGVVTIHVCCLGHGGNSLVVMALTSGTA